MKTLFFIALLIFSSSIWSATFSAGESFNAVRIQGSLMVSCNDQNGPSTGHALCSSEILNPSEYTYFIGPIIDADTLIIKAIYENGVSSKEKTLAYDGVKGKSKKSINLWIASVFQRPLLNYGKNIIKYLLMKNGKRVDEGEFYVHVKSGDRGVCQRVGYYYSTMSSDCSFPQNFCGRYFQENNYCQ